jgi:hypothetical protein
MNRIIPSFRKIFSSPCLQGERKFVRNPIWSLAKRKPNGIPDKIAFPCLKAGKSDFSGMTKFLLCPLFGVSA